MDIDNDEFQAEVSVEQLDKVQFFATLRQHWDSVQSLKKNSGGKSETDGVAWLLLHVSNVKSFNAELLNQAPQGDLSRGTWGFPPYWRFLQDNRGFILSYQAQVVLRIPYDATYGDWNNSVVVKGRVGVVLVEDGRNLEEFSETFTSYNTNEDGVYVFYIQTTLKPENIKIPYHKLIVENETLRQIGRRNVSHSKHLFAVKSGYEITTFRDAYSLGVQPDGLNDMVFNVYKVAGDNVFHEDTNCETLKGKTFGSRDREDVTVPYERLLREGCVECSIANSEPLWKQQRHYTLLEHFMPWVDALQALNTAYINDEDPYYSANSCYQNAKDLKNKYLNINEGKFYPVIFALAALLEEMDRLILPVRTGQPPFAYEHVVNNIIIAADDEQYGRVEKLAFDSGGTYEGVEQLMGIIIEGGNILLHKNVLLHTFGDNASVKEFLTKFKQLMNEHMSIVHTPLVWVGAEGEFAPTHEAVRLMLWKYGGSTVVKSEGYLMAVPRGLAELVSVNPATKTAISGKVMLGENINFGRKVLENQSKATSGYFPLYQLAERLAKYREMKHTLPPGKPVMWRDFAEADTV